MKRLLFNKGKGIFLACTFAFLQCFLGYSNFKSLCLAEHYNYSMYDFFNYLFVGSNIGEVPYLSKKDLTLLILPLAVLIFGMFISSINFLGKPEGYIQFIYSRTKSEKQLVKKLFLEELDNILIYVLTYYSMVVVCVINLVNRQLHIEVLWKAILFGVISKILFFMFMKSVSLYLYMKMGLIRTVLFAVSMVCCIFMINIAFRNTVADVLLFSNRFNIFGLVLLTVATFGFVQMNRKIDLLKL